MTAAVAAETEAFAGPAGMIFALVWGAVWGSFFNVVIARLPRGESIVRPPSHCFACGAPVKAFDNVPVLSYLWLRGRCRACRARIAPRYPLVEALTAALAVGLWWVFVVAEPVPGPGLALRLARFSLYFAFVGTLTVLAFIDLDTKRLPDVITLPGTAIFFAAGFAVADVPWSERAIGAAAGYLFVRIIADFYYHVLKREGLGLGDGKLLALIGAVEGWRALPIVVFVASLTGTAVSIPVLLLAGRRRPPPETSSRDGETDQPRSLSWRRIQIPFGPFIAVGAITYLLAGRRILTWLLGGDGDG